MESSELRPDRVSFDPSRVPTSPTVPLPQSMQTTTQSAEEVLENTNINTMDERTGVDDKIVEQETIQDVSMDMNTGDRDSDPIAIGDQARLEAISVGADINKPEVKKFH